MANFDNILNKEDIESILTKIIKEKSPSIFLNSVKSSNNPSYTAMAGLPGAGKSTLIKQIAHDLPEGAVLIDTNLMRDYIPGYVEMAANPATSHEAADFSHKPAGQLAQRLAEYAFEHRYNIIQDGTLANLERSDAKFAKATQEGYSLSIQAVTVHPDISTISVYERYADHIKNHTPARLVPNAAIDKMQAEIPSTIDALAAKYNIKSIRACP